ncbi:NlpC/P60 family protein [Aquibium microcysteis]|uniref:C40 family peptidase n=1 Tax=Aquibium microcysteis TaxID=675281 RepID=UPI00165D2271|nr:NlpC/P60 family protein [Aquibium microcysteis]
MTLPDKRLHAYRSDLADLRLQGRVEAGRFVAGRPMRVVGPVLDMLAGPSRSAGLNTQLLRGAPVAVYDEQEGLAWVQAGEDGYVGYVEAGGLGPADAGVATHVVAVPRTFLYAGPDMKKPRTEALSMGSQIEVVGETETRGTLYALLPTGEAAVAAHLRPLAESAGDWVAVAETLEHTPYLWGGASAFGIDCSGLVQLAMRMSGLKAPRDSDMQAAGIGSALGADADRASLKRGDLVFWKGHVAIVTGPDAIIHANGHTMTVARESLSGAIARIGYLYGQPTGFRRP